jgi:acyl carrier protein
MKIKINGTDADIRPENEKTVGEILSALDSWLAGTGHRLSGLNIDGKAVNAQEMELSFSRDIDSIDTLDICTSSLLQLTADSLGRTMRDIADFQEAVFDDKAAFAGKWKESPQGCLLAEQYHELFEWTIKAFSGEGCSPQVLNALYEERLRELLDPSGEMARTERLVDDICARLAEFPLDIQTGKDARAAETVNVFSGIAEKVFRVYNVLKIERSLAEITVDNMPVNDYITEFNKALKELLDAYERRDTVLVGDLAEYEMAPRLRCLHAAILGAVKGENHEHGA